MVARTHAPKNGLKMKVVIDTNIFVSSFSSNSDFHDIFKSLVEGKYQLLVSNAMMLEYGEIMARKYGEAGGLVFEEILRTAPNVIHSEPFIDWKIITQDPEDDKFANCAICGGADFIVTNDKHYNVVNDNEFPPMRVIKMAEFQKILRGL
jgi:uncharacterized protein